MIMVPVARHGLGGLSAINPRGAGADRKTLVRACILRGILWLLWRNRYHPKNISQGRPTQ
jgi:hypothetical protein